MKLIDSHCHLDAQQFDSDRDQVIKKARKAHVASIITSGTNILSSAKAVELAEFYDDVFATAGIHPVDGESDLLDSSWPKKLEALARKLRVVAIGECGLDYFRKSENKLEQQKLLIKQLELAGTLDLPVVLHCRQAFDDLFAILKSFPNLRGLFHSWTGNYNDAKTAMEFNFLFGFGGILTYPNASDIAQVCVSLPIWRIALETDSPYLSPQNKRSQRNEPANVLAVAQKVAQLHQINLEDLAEATTKNVIRMFSLP